MRNTLTLTLLTLIFRMGVCDYSMRFRVNSKIRSDNSTEVHFVNCDSTTFYNKVNIKYSTKLVSSIPIFRILTLNL